MRVLTFDRRRIVDEMHRRVGLALREVEPRHLTVERNDQMRTLCERGERTSRPQFADEILKAVFPRRTLGMRASALRNSRAETTTTSRLHFSFVSFSSHNLPRPIGMAVLSTTSIPAPTLAFPNSLDLDGSPCHLRRSSTRAPLEAVALPASMARTPRHAGCARIPSLRSHASIASLARLRGKWPPEGVRIL